jgi:hypothetical protein
MLKKVAQKLLLLGFSVVVTLGLCEIALRIAHIGFPSLGGKLSIYTWDDHTGLGLRPGQAQMGHSENDVFIRINNEGQHDVEHTKQKPPKTFRIAVLGDSFTEAMQVPVEKNFTSVMERQLNGCPQLGGKHVEAINFGVSGFGTAQELEKLRHEAWDYSPDLVVLAFFTGNDIQNNSRILQQDPYRPYFVLENGKLVLDDSFVHEPGFHAQFSAFNRFLSWMVGHSRVLQVVVAAKNYHARKNVDGVKPTEMGLDDNVYHDPTDPVWKDAWSVTDDLIGVMNQEVKAHGAQLLVVTLTSSIQVSPDGAAREALEKRLGVPNLYYPDERVAQVAKRDDIPVLTLAPLFLQYAQEHNVQLHGFRGSNQGHWNEAGHELGGELMAKKICEMEAPAMPANALASNTDGSDKAAAR